MGVVECLKHNLVEPFSVLYDKEGEWAVLDGDDVMTTPPLCVGEFVAQYKFTVLLMPNGPLR